MQYDDLEWSEWDKHKDDPACRRYGCFWNAVAWNCRRSLGAHWLSGDSVHWTWWETTLVLGYRDTVEEAKALMSKALREVFDGSWISRRDGRRRGR